MTLDEIRKGEKRLKALRLQIDKLIQEESGIKEGIESTRRTCSHVWTKRTYDKVADTFSRRCEKCDTVLVSND